MNQVFLSHLNWTLLTPKSNKIKRQSL